MIRYLTDDSTGPSSDPVLDTSKLASGVGHWDLTPSSYISFYQRERWLILVCAYRGNLLLPKKKEKKKKRFFNSRPFIYSLLLFLFKLGIASLTLYWPEYVAVFLKEAIPQPPRVGDLGTRVLEWFV